LLEKKKKTKSLNSALHPTRIKGLLPGGGVGNKKHPKKTLEKKKGL